MAICQQANGPLRDQSNPESQWKAFGWLKGLLEPYSGSGPRVRLRCPSL